MSLSSLSYSSRLRESADIVLCEVGGNLSKFPVGEGGSPTMRAHQAPLREALSPPWVEPFPQAADSQETR